MSRDSTQGIAIVMENSVMTICVNGCDLVSTKKKNSKDFALLHLLQTVVAYNGQAL
jgi:hypothetical protein